MGCSGISTKRIKELKILDSFEDAENSPGVAHLILSKDNLIISGTLNGFIKMYKIENSKFREIYSNQEHTEAITCIASLDSKRIISSSLDNSIKIFEIKSSSLSILKSHLSHENAVSQVLPLRDGNHFATCSMDYTIRIFKSKDPYEEVTKYEDEKKALSIAQIDSGVIASIHMENDKDEDSIMYFWSFKNKELTKVHTIEGNHDFRPFFVWGMKKNRFAISCKNYLLILNGSNFNTIRRIEEDWKVQCSSFFQLDDEYAYVTCGGMFYQILLVDFSCCFKENNEAMDGESVISASEDGKLIVVNKEKTFTLFEVTFI